jgi:ariadne-2
LDAKQLALRNTHPEYFIYECLTIEEVERLLNESVELLSNALQIEHSLAKLLLHTNEWEIEDIIVKYLEDPCKFLVESKNRHILQTRLPQGTFCIGCVSCAWQHRVVTG